MKNFLRHFRLSENLLAHGNYKTPRRSPLYVFSSLVFLFAFYFLDAQRNFLSANNSSNSIAANFGQQKNGFHSYTKYFEENGGYAPNHFATITSTVTGGNWDDPGEAGSRAEERIALTFLTECRGSDLPLWLRALLRPF